jgi:hypothetical protein
VQEIFDVLTSQCESQTAFKKAYLLEVGGRRWWAAVLGGVGRCWAVLGGVGR